MVAGRQFWKPPSKSTARNSRGSESPTITSSEETQLKQAVKRHLKLLFPEAVGAYHFYRTATQYRRMQPKQTGWGFAFIGMPSMQDGAFEPAETATIVTALDQIDLFIDGGANTGYFTCIARHHGIKTIAIEPLADNLDVLYANLGR